MCDILLISLSTLVAGCFNRAEGYKFARRVEQLMTDRLDNLFQKAQRDVGLLGELRQEGWIPYQGPQGGRGWKNTETGEVNYDDDFEPPEQETDRPDDPKSPDKSKPDEGPEDIDLGEISRNDMVTVDLGDKTIRGRVHTAPNPDRGFDELDVIGPNGETIRGVTKDDVLKTDEPDFETETAEEINPYYLPNERLDNGFLKGTGNPKTTGHINLTPSGSFKIFDSADPRGSPKEQFDDPNEALDFARKEYGSIAMSPNMEKAVNEVYDHLEPEVVEDHVEQMASEAVVETFLGAL